MNKKIKISNFQFGTSFNLKIYVIISLLLLCTNSFSQYNENKWTISASFDAVDLYPTGIKTDAPYYPQGGIFEDLFNVSDHWNFGGPSVSISKLIYKGLYFGTEMSINKIKKIEGQDNFNYTFYGGQVFLKKTFYSTKKTRPFLKLGYGVSGIDRGLFGDTIPFSQYFSKTLSPGFGVHFRITNNFGFEISSSFNKAYGKATWYLCNGGPGGGCDAYVKLELKGDSLKVQYPERIKDGNLYYSEVFGKSIN